LLWSTLCLHALGADPPIKLGIQRDFEDKTANPIFSYSAWIEFKESARSPDGFPPETMSSEKLVKLTIMAYDEMRKLHSDLLFPPERRPSAMIGLAMGKHIFFASSMKGDYKSYYAPVRKEGESRLRAEVREALIHCQTLAASPKHQTNLGCGEPSVYDVAFASEVKVEGYNRIAPCVAFGPGQAPINIKPCGKKGSGYGCDRIVEQFGSNVVASKQPDAGDGSEWKDQFVVRTKKRFCMAESNP
jgi:hypothetical protein